MNYEWLSFTTWFEHKGHRSSCKLGYLRPGPILKIQVLEEPQTTQKLKSEKLLRKTSSPVLTVLYADFSLQTLRLAPWLHLRPAPLLQVSLVIWHARLTIYTVISPALLTSFASSRWDPWWRGSCSGMLGKNPSSPLFSEQPTLTVPSF